MSGCACGWPESPCLGGDTAACPAYPGPASVSPAEPPRRRIKVTPIPNAEYVRADDPDARAMAVFEALYGSILELFWNESDDAVDYEVEDYDPDA